MDFGSFIIGGIPVIVLVIGIVEACKNFGVTGKWSQVLALALGAFFVGLAQAINAGLIPSAALPWIEVVVIGIGGGLAATGLYDLSRKLLVGGR